jgi:hypothetical protein
MKRTFEELPVGTVFVLVTESRESVACKKTLAGCDVLCFDGKNLDAVVKGHVLPDAEVLVVLLQ